MEVSFSVSEIVVVHEHRGFGWLKANEETGTEADAQQLQLQRGEQSSKSLHGKSEWLVVICIFAAAHTFPLSVQGIIPAKEISEAIIKAKNFMLAKIAIFNYVSVKPVKMKDWYADYS